jgi:hypothetical protein
VFEEQDGTKSVPEGGRAEAHRPRDRPYGAQRWHHYGEGSGRSGEGQGQAGRDSIPALAGHIGRRSHSSFRVPAVRKVRAAAPTECPLASIKSGACCTGRFRPGQCPSRIINRRARAADFRPQFLPKADCISACPRPTQQNQGLESTVFGAPATLN